MLAHTTTSPSLDIKIKERATRPRYPLTLHSQSARNQSIIYLLQQNPTVGALVTGVEQSGTVVEAHLVVASALPLVQTTSLYDRLKPRTPPAGIHFLPSLPRFRRRLP